MRGEHSVSCTSAHMYLGSSPHARGALLRRLEYRDEAGIIPACAGSTPAEASGEVGLGDHPRMRGEHLFLQSLACGLLGSSPHARGAPG